MSSIGELLIQFDLGELHSDFEKNQITIDNLLECDSLGLNELIKELIPCIGLRLRFLKNWKEYMNDISQVSIDEGSVSTPNPTKIVENPKKKTEEKGEPDDVDIANFDLKKILKNDAIGKAVLKIYENNLEPLDSRSQSYICDVICTYFLNTCKRRLINAHFALLSQKIVDIFEKEITDTYYVGPVKKRDSRENKPGIAKGKLVDKYRNKLSFINSSNKEIKAIREVLETSESEPGDTLLENAQAWLKYNDDPWIEVIEKWEITKNNRQNAKWQITEMFKAYPILVGPKGNLLIEHDFDTTYTGKNLKLLQGWQTFFDKVQKLHGKKISSPLYDMQLKMLKTNINEDCKTYLQIILLCAMIPPKTSHKKVGEKKTYKPSVIDAQCSIVEHVVLYADIEKKKKTNKS